MNNQDKKGIASLKLGRLLLHSLSLSLMLLSMLFLAPRGVAASPLPELGQVMNMYPPGGSSNTVTAGNNFSVYVQVYKNGVTDSAGPGANLTCTLHWGQVSSFGGAWSNTTDTPMAYNTDVGNNDEYRATISPAAGLYEYTAFCTDMTDSNSTWQGSGDGRLTVSPAPPTVTTNPATLIGISHATLNGTVNANGDSTNVTFEYGPTIAYGTTVTAGQSPVNGATNTTVTAVLTGLTSNTTYHFRAVGINAGGTVNGLDATFTTACLSAITVTNASNSGAGSLRQAIADLCPGGTITFDNDYTIPLTSELSIDKNLTITGVGHSVTVSGNHVTRVFNVSGGSNTTFDTLTIANGLSSGDGGGIYNAGGLLVTNSTISGNWGSYGGGIYNSRDLSITNSTISGNGASYGGGGIYNAGGLTVTNSTFSENSAPLGSSLYIEDMMGIVTVHNTLLMTPGENCFGGVGGTNYLVTDNSCGMGATVTDANSLRLAPLGDYGGPTQTYALLPGSPAINAGNPADCTGSDQRGANYVGACDIGAFESQGFTLAVGSGNNQSALINTAFANPLEVTVTANDPAEPVDGGTVTFTPPASGASAVLTTSPSTISGSAASVTANANGTVGAYNVTADTAGASAGVTFSLTNITVPTVITGVATAITASGATLNGTINANGVSTAVTFQYGLNIPYGSTITADQSPVTGAVDTAISAALTGLTPNTTYHFRAAGNNGFETVNGLDATFTTACLSAITVTNNADSGAGSLRQAIADVCAGGTIDFDGDYTIHLASQLSITKGLTIDGSGHSVTISGDSDNDGMGDVRVFWVSANAVFLDKLKIVKGRSDSDGGGLYLDSGYLFIQNSTFSGNSTKDNNSGDGGGLYANGILVIQNSTFADNLAGHYGGAIFSHWNLSISNSTLSGNVADFGGGIYNENPDLHIQKSTFSGNMAEFALGAGLFNVPGQAHIYNTLIANSAGSDCYSGGASLDASGSLIEDGTCGALLSGDPRLAPLGNYGGPTQTFALLPGSPAINAGTCLSADQRGAALVGTCDIGAFESQGFTLAVGGGNNQSALINTAFANSLEVTVTANDPAEPVNGGQIAFTSPASGASAFLAGNPVTVIGNAASITATANSTTGLYNVTAITPGAASINFALVNIEPSAITSADNIAFTVGVMGNFTVTTTGDPTVSNITQTGALPAGVTFTDNGDGTATLGGIPLAGSGGVHPLTFTASSGTPPNATQNFTLTVNEGLAFTSANNATFTVGMMDSFMVMTSGYPASAITWTGSLPSGVTLTDNQDGTATLTGIPSVGGIYNLNITASNGVLTDATQNFTLTVYQAPNDISLSLSNIAENNAINAVIGNLSAADLDAGDTFVYNLVDGGAACPGTDNTFFNINSDNLLASSSFDFETLNSYVICVRATDSNSLTFDKPFTISIININEAPIMDAATLSINENSINGTSVGTVTYTDPDASQVHTFSITEGNTGSAFAINPTTGEIIVAAASMLDFETTSAFTLTVLVSDNGTPNLSASNTITINLNNIAEAPAVTTNPATAITFSGATLNGIVNANNDSTIVAFEYGLTNVYSATITADQSPVTGLMDTVVSATISGLTPNATYHYRVVGVNSDGTVNGLDRTFTTNMVAPTVLSSTNANTNPTNAVSVDFTVTFSTSVIGVEPLDFDLVTSGVSGAAVSGVSGSGSSHTVTVSTGTGNGTIQLVIPASATITDEAGNSLANLPFNTGETYTVTRNAAPTGLDISASIVTENQPTGTTVGFFTSTDPDLGDTFIYSLVSGAGGNDNVAFTISANILKTTHPFNFAVKNSYSIRVRTTDSDSQSFERVFTIAIVDAPPIFADVTDNYWAVSWIERLYNAGMTDGCSLVPLNYCPENTVTRAQAAVVLLKGVHGSSYTPPAVGSDTGFADVMTNYWAAAWIKQLAAEGITSGCGDGNYCPEAAVTRAQMAIFLLKAKHGSAYFPPNAAGVFTDVPADYWARNWIEQLAIEGITYGCRGSNYCPDADVSRAQLAVFLVKAFNLP